MVTVNYCYLIVSLFLDHRVARYIHVLYDDRVKKRPFFHNILQVFTHRATFTMHSTFKGATTGRRVKGIFKIIQIDANNVVESQLKRNNVSTAIYK